MTELASHQQPMTMTPHLQPAASSRDISMSASPCVGRSPALLDANCETSPTIPPPEIADAGRPDARPSAPGHSLRIEVKVIASQIVHPDIRAEVHPFMR